VRGALAAAGLDHTLLSLVAQAGRSPAWRHRRDSRERQLALRLRTWNESAVAAAAQRSVAEGRGHRRAEPGDDGPSTLHRPVPQPTCGFPSRRRAATGDKLPPGQADPAPPAVEAATGDQLPVDLGGTAPEVEAAAVREPGVIRWIEELERDDGHFAVVGLHCSRLQRLADDLDAAVFDFMRAGAEDYEVAVPNMFLGVLSPDGKLVYARGFTQYCAFPSPDEVFIAGPTTQMRVASLTKPVTAAVAARAAYDGAFGAGGMSAAVNDFVTVGSRATHRLQIESRLEDITIDDLMRHRAGWNDVKEVVVDGIAMAGSATLNDAVVAAWYGHDLPVTQHELSTCGLEALYQGATAGQTEWEVVAEQRSQHYSNFGYFLLGRAVEGATGLSYQNALQRLILRPLGMASSQVGRSTLTDRLDDEVVYYNNAGLSSGDSACEGDWQRSVLETSTTPTYTPTPPFIVYQGPCVAPPYGSNSMHSMDSHGGLVTTAIDYARFLREIQGFTSAALPRLYSQVLRSDFAGYGTFAADWSMSRLGTRRTHGGTLRGTTAWATLKVTEGEAWSFVFCCNTERPKSSDHPSSTKTREVLAATLDALLESVGNWRSCDGLRWLEEVA
jgi:CubicO group peptidase (beta-lactamase class C family)